MNKRIFIILGALLLSAFIAGMFKNITAFAVIATMVLITDVFIKRNTLMEHLSESGLIILIAFVANTVLSKFVSGWEISDSSWIGIIGMLTVIFNLRFAHYKVLRKVG